MSTAIGTYIRERRQDLGLNQAQLAERMGEPYGPSAISCLERGFTGVPRLRTLNRLAMALEVPVSDLLVASGWFIEGHFTTQCPRAQAGQQDSLLVEIEVEQETGQLRAMIREMELMSRFWAPMTGEPISLGMPAQRAGTPEEVAAD